MAKHELRQEMPGWRRYLEDDAGNMREIHCGAPLALVYKRRGSDCKACRGLGETREVGLRRRAEVECSHCAGRGFHYRTERIPCRYEASNLSDVAGEPSEYLYLDFECRVALTNFTRIEWDDGRAVR